MAGKNYWAKDLVFLVTEQEQLGMQAWLEAYHDGYKNYHSSSSYLVAGSLPARAGSLQAALNIEVQDLEVGWFSHTIGMSHHVLNNRCVFADYVDVKVEGLNGKLPNLDMFNLVQRIMAREGVTSGYKHAPRKRRRMNLSPYEQNLRQMLAMLATQATGVPNGNHGLFHRYRIDALTLSAAKRVTNSNVKSNPSSATVPLLKSIEGISRSLNNLLERFHQSFFFYVIVHNDRYISIGDYMPALVALIACSFVKAYLSWSTLDAAERHAQQDAAGNETDPVVFYTKLSLPYGFVLVYLVVTLVIGYMGNVLPLQKYLMELSIGAGPLTLTMLIALNVAGIALPFYVVLPPGGLELLHICMLLVYGCALIVIGLLNFSLGFLVAVLSVPMVVALNPSSTNGALRGLARLWALLLNPMVVIYTVVLVLTFYEFPELTFQQLLLRAVTAVMDAVTFALIDSVVSAIDRSTFSND